MKEKSNKEDKLGFFRFMAWSSSSVSTAINVLMLGFLMVYCTNTLGLGAAVVGSILMFSKIFDGFTDFLAGYIVDKTNTRFGRGRPYELSLIGLWLSTWLLFSCPEQFSYGAKCLWVFFMYAFNQSVFMTVLNANGTVYMVRSFSKQSQYVKITSFSAIPTFIGAILFNICFPVMMGNMATSYEGWSTLIAMFALPLMVFGLLRFIFIKEINDIDAKTENKLNIRDIMILLKSNKYVYIVGFMSFVYTFVVSMGVGVYYFTYIGGGVGVMGALAAVTIISIPVPLFFPILIKKFSVRMLIIVGLIISILGYTLQFFALDNFSILAIATLLTGVGNVPINMLVGLLIIDCADYNEYNGLHRMEGTIGSFRGLLAKFGAAISVGVTGFILGLSGFDGTLSVQPDSAIMAIRILFSLAPAILMISVVFVVKFYDLEKKLPEIRKELESRRKTAATEE